MIEFIKRLRERARSSLKFTMLYALVLGVLLAVCVYSIVKFATNFYIDYYYLSDENRTLREYEYAHELQEYVTEQELSSDDTALLARWARSNRYLYIMVHKDDQLLFESGADTDLEAEGDGGDGFDSVGTESESFVPGAGITVDLPTREDLIEYAEEKDSHLITMKDASVLVSMADYTEYLYYDIFNIAALIIALATVVIVLMIYFQSVTSRITNLATQVMVVADGEMERVIERDGVDEIGRLSRDVENMRASMLEAVAKERAAVDANTSLITSMSHDIRTPLTVLLGYIDIMKMRSNDPEMSGYIEASEQTALRLKKLSDDLFNYFLVFGGEALEVEMEEYEAVVLLEQMISEHVLLMKEQGYTLSFDIEEGSREKIRNARVLTDAPRLMRIIENLFSNVLKYADKVAPVLISAQVDESKLLLTMSNKIDGNTRNVESNHIGLRTCNKIAEAIGAEFVVRECDGNFIVGLTLNITFDEGALK